MPSTYTPLRYPGGKAKLGPYLSDVLRFNRLSNSRFVEPYAGGAGAALFLLVRGYVQSIHLNDINGAVASFWRAILTKTERFARRVEEVPLTVEEWERQRSVYTSAKSGFELGFAFFYLNRTNRSGIMNGGVIGGKRQVGKWLIDARFNRADLADRIRTVGSLKRLITVSSDDALEVLSSISRTKEKANTFVYLDPPYFHKGKDLYTNFYTPEDHVRIARRLKRLSCPWMLTYDACDEIRDLYVDLETRESALSYSARNVRRGREIVVFSASVRPPVNVQRREGFRILDS